MRANSDVNVDLKQEWSVFLLVGDGVRVCEHAWRQESEELFPKLGQARTASLSRWDLISLLRITEFYKWLKAFKWSQWSRTLPPPRSYTQ